jgi:hypothetical protein
MKVGDLVGFLDYGLGIIIERIPDADPDYFAWRVLSRGEVLEIHESFLKVVDESR